MAPVPAGPVTTTEVTPALLREWLRPQPAGGKEGRGRALVVGGSTETPARCCRVPAVLAEIEQ